MRKRPAVLTRRAENRRVGKSRAGPANRVSKVFTYLFMTVEMNGCAKGQAGFSGNYPATNTIQLASAPAP